MAELAITPERLREQVRAGGLLGDGPLVAMVSGGRDSVCLLDVAVALRGAARVCALHVNYGLRGDASDADEQLCAELCAQLGVALERVRVERGPRAGGNLQAWAREQRYDAALALAERLQLQGRGERALVATGHTASDQLETILYRLAASPGRRALLGMRPLQGRLVRPLLPFTREQTAAYCSARGLRWREDASNDDERYARARVRRRLVPALLAVHPAARESVLRTSEQLREESELLDELVERELDGADSIELARLARMRAALARLVLVRLAEDALAEPVPQAGAHLEELLALARRGGPAELHVGAGAAAVIAEGRLRFHRLPPRAPRGEAGAPEA